ncbi:MAG: M48 family metallopeptidase [bacterium]|nr:M48 family metallopeptidase [bacterium]
MDFFEAQERARKRTNRLVVLFAFAVLGTMLAGYVAAMLAVNYAGGSSSRRGGYYYETRPAAVSDWWNPVVFLWVAGGTSAIVGLASLYKWSQMREGGSAIAEMVGGRPVDPKTTDLRERKLPAVYVLEDEPGLNAFAAGLTTSDAAVCVTRGSLDKLTRDELQGVIGHEFSHILNGDMKLNVRITAIVFGILFIGLIGRGILQSLGRGRSSGGKKDGGVVALLGLGLALMVIGYIGYFFGRLIQAAVSRQREFLADASAVQFTRNPGGITGALRKIGGYALGGNVVGRNTAELGHFFFAQAFISNFGGLWATHPPLAERIRAVDPTWDGKLYEPEEVVDIAHETFATAGFGGGTRFPANETLERVHAAPADIPPSLAIKPVAFKPAHIVADIGAVTESHFRHAQLLLETIPARLRESTRDPAAAQVLVYGLLLNGDKAARDHQQQLVEKFAGPGAATALAGLRTALSLLEPVARLPLLQLSMPALRTLDRAALDRFVTTLDELVHADGVVTPFEYAMQKMLLSQLELAKQPVQRVQFESFDAVRSEIAVVLSSLAHLSPKDSAGAFAEGAGQMPVIRDQLALLPAAACGLAQVDAALDKLVLSTLPIKQRLLVAAGHVIANDGTVTVEEGELYRAFSATLGCPMPSLGQAA